MGLPKNSVLSLQALCEMVLSLLWTCFVLAGIRGGKNQLVNGTSFGMNRLGEHGTYPNVPHYIPVG